MQSDVFSVIADPTRRHIVHLLAEQTRTVGAIVEDLNMSQPTISKHLKILRETGAATVLVEGQRRLYSLNPEVFDEITAWIADIQAIAQSTKAQRESQVKRAVALERDEDAPAAAAGSDAASSKNTPQTVPSESAELVSDQKAADGEATSVKDLQGLKPAVKTENAVHSAAADVVAGPEAAEKDQEPGQQEQGVSSRDAGTSRTTDAHVSAIQNSAARISARSSAASGKAAEPAQERPKAADSVEDQTVKSDKSETAAQKPAGRHAEQESADEKSVSPQAAGELTGKNVDSSAQNTDVQGQVVERASSTEEASEIKDKPRESASPEVADTQTSPEGSSKSSDAVTEPAPVTSPQERASRTLSQGKRFDAFPGSTGSSKSGVKAVTAQEGSSSAQSSAVQDQMGTDQAGAGDSRVQSASAQGSEAEGTDDSAAKKKTTTAAIAKPAIFDESQAAEHTHTSTFVPKESTSSAARIVSKPAPSPAPVTSAEEPEEDEVIPLRPFTPSGSSYQEEKPAQVQSYGYDDGVADGQQDFSAQDGGFTARKSSAKTVQSGEDTQPGKQAEQAQSDTLSREQNRMRVDAAAEADTPVQPQEAAAKTKTAKAHATETQPAETSTLESSVAEISTPSAQDVAAPKAETPKTETSALKGSQPEPSEQAQTDHEAAQTEVSGTYGLDEGQPSRAGEKSSASAQTRPAAQQPAALYGQKPGEGATDKPASEESVTEPATPAAATAKTAVSETTDTGETAAAPATEAKTEDAQPASTSEQETIAPASGESRKAEQTQVQQEQKPEDSDSSGSAETPETIEAKLARNAPVSSESVTFTAVLPVVTPEDSTLQGATPPEEDEDSARAADQPETQESEKKQSTQTQKLPYQTQTEYTSAFGTADSPKEAARGLLSRVFGRRR